MFRSSIGILFPFSVSQYQSQLGPFTYFINMHDCPEVHAQLFIIRVSQTESWSDLKCFGVVLWPSQSTQKRAGMLKAVMLCSNKMGAVTAERESHLTADKHKKTGLDLRSKLKLDVIWNDRYHHHSQCSCLDCPVLNLRFMFPISVS